MKYLAVAAILLVLTGGVYAWLPPAGGGPSGLGVLAPPKPSGGGGGGGGGPNPPPAGCAGVFDYSVGCALPH